MIRKYSNILGLEFNSKNDSEDSSDDLIEILGIFIIFKTMLHKENRIIFFI